MTGAEGINFVTIRIDEKKCKRCYDCVTYCVSGALTLDKGIFNHDATNCCYCEVCMDVCRTAAIEISER